MNDINREPKSERFGKLKTFAQLTAVVVGGAILDGAEFIAREVKKPGNILYAAEKQAQENRNERKDEVKKEVIDFVAKFRR